MTADSQLSLLPVNDVAIDTVATARPDRIGGRKTETTIDYAPAREILTRATGFMDAYDFTLNPLQRLLLRLHLLLCCFLQP